jgi:hypothetical protein
LEDEMHLGLRRILITAATIASAAALSTTAAAADPPSPPNGHNCAGAAVSELAEPGFGQVVSAAAHQQAVDNFNLANCGQDNRNNPGSAPASASSESDS